MDHGKQLGLNNHSAAAEMVMATDKLNKAKQLVYLSATKSVQLSANTGKQVSFTRSDFTGLLDSDNIVFATASAGDSTSVYQNLFLSYGMNSGTGTSSSNAVIARLVSSSAATYNVTARILVER